MRSRETLNDESVIQKHHHPRSEGEISQKLLYLKQAIIGFFKAKNGVEMEHLGRVICAILELNVEEQAHVMEGIAKLTPTVVATSTFESLTSNISSLFA